MQADLLARVVAALEAAGIPHMVTGSFASTFHGEPRMTHDIDLVVDPDPEVITVFVRAFDGPEFYVDDAAAAVARRGMFNVVDLHNGWKVDLIVRKERPYSIEEFGRRQRATIAGVDTFVASVEDSILSKLEWSSSSASERQFRDTVTMIRVQRERLDLDYLRRWAVELGVEAGLDRALRAADEGSE